MLLSNVQYFTLNEKLRTMKFTLARSASELLPFTLVFLLFFCVMALIGMYLFGPTLDAFKDYYSSVTTCFGLMLGLSGFAEIETALPREEGSVTMIYIAAAVYYYSFVFLHFFVLLNMVIAIVVDAYVDVKNEAKTKVRQGATATQASPSEPHHVPKPHR